MRNEVFIWFVKLDKIKNIKTKEILKCMIGDMPNKYNYLYSFDGISDVTLDGFRYNINIVSDIITLLYYPPNLDGSKNSSGFGGTGLEFDIFNDKFDQDTHIKNCNYHAKCYNMGTFLDIKESRRKKLEKINEL